MMGDGMFSVGQVAKRTSVTVKTLHHYESKGLLMPSARSAAGYRLYSLADIAVLQHIILLRSYGFSIAEIQVLLVSEDGPLLLESLNNKINAAQTELQTQQRTLLQLMKLQTALENNANCADTFFETIEEIVVHDKYFNEQQQLELNQRKQEIAEGELKRVQQRWPLLIAQVQEAMAEGKAVDSAEVKALAQEWQGLVAAFTGGNSEITSRLSIMYEQEPQVQQTWGVEPALMAYISSALGAV